MDVSIQQTLMQDVGNYSYEKTESKSESENAFGKMLEEKVEIPKESEGSKELGESKELTPEMLTPLWVNIQQIPKPKIVELDAEDLKKLEAAIEESKNAIEVADKVQKQGTVVDAVDQQILNKGGAVDGTEGDAKAFAAIGDDVNTQVINQSEKASKKALTGDKTNGVEVERLDNQAVDKSLVTNEQPIRAQQSEARVSTTESVIKPEYIEQINQKIVENLANGNKEFEIQLNPRNLGELVIKATYEDGKAVVSIVCKEVDVLQAMARSSIDLANILELKLGQETQVVVETPRSDYLQQENQKEQHNQQQKQEEKSNTDELRENSDFLQQLRLGIA